MILPPGNCSNIEVIAMNTSDGPEAISEPAPTTEGIITKPASIAIAESQITTQEESFLRLFSSGMLAPSVIKIAQPIPTEKRTCMQASATVVVLSFDTSGTRYHLSPSIAPGEMSSAHTPQIISSTRSAGRITLQIFSTLSVIPKPRITQVTRITPKP